MRKLLLAGVATLGATVALADVANAQGAPPNPMQGTMATAPTVPARTYGDNNYMSGTMEKGSIANPTPGTMVVHLGAVAMLNMPFHWANQLDDVGGVHLTHYEFQEYIRMYPGVDAMATNGLRYGAAFEIRQNFAGPTATTGANGGTAYTSTQTLYVRRAFAYVAGDSWGIVRLGEMDGLIGTYDGGGQTTGVFLSPSGTIVGGDLQAGFPGNASMTPYFAAQSGNEYGNTKLVYLSPSFAGFDFGFQYAPNPFNGYAIGAGGCGSALGDSACPGLASTVTVGVGSRTKDQWAVGARYRGNFGGVGVLAYGVYMGSGTTAYNGSAAAANATGPVGNTYNGGFDGLSLGMVGANVTFSGLSIFGNVMVGDYNGILAAKPKGGDDGLGWGIGAKYVMGPASIGLVYSHFRSQGDQRLTGLSNRKEQVIYVAGTYAVAPGFTVFADWLWQSRKQPGFNFVTSGVGPTATTPNSDIHSTGFMLGTAITW